MGLLNVSGKKNSDSESQEKTEPKSRDREQRDIMKLMGSEFRVVKNGLDPADVSSFIETAAGSSEAALKRLEHFTSLRRLSEMMEGMVKETQQVSEQIKEQVKQEAEDEKAQVVEVAKYKAEEMISQTKETCVAQIEGTNSVILEAKLKAEEMVNQTRDGCLAHVEGTNSILLEAATKARQLEEMAFQKAKEMGDMNAGAMQKNIQNVVASVHHDLNSVFEQFTKELETSQFRIAEISSDVEETISELAEVEESEMASEIPEAEPISNEIEDEELLPVIEATDAGEQEIVLTEEPISELAGIGEDETVNRITEDEPLDIEILPSVTRQKTMLAEEPVPEVADMEESEPVNRIIESEPFMLEIEDEELLPVTETTDAGEQEAALTEEPISELAEVEESTVVNEIPEAEPVSIEIEDEEVIPIIKANPVASTEDGEATLYSGKVTLAIPRPAGVLWMSQLRQRLLSSPGVRILLQAGSDKGESILNLSLDEPIPLTSILMEMPNVERVIEENSKTAKSSGHLSKILKRNLPKELQQTTLVIMLSRNGKSKS